MPRRRRRQKKIQPSELVLNFQLEGGTPGTSYIDLAQSLSALNRKFFRQGYEYVVAGVELISNDDCTVIINRLNRNWVTYNSWTKAQALWKKQQDETMDDAGLEDTVGRYRDFKVRVDGYQRDAPATDYTFADGNLKPMNVLTLAAAQVIDPEAQYEWNYSDVVVPNAEGVVGDTEQYQLHMIGDDVGTVSRGVVKAYAESRARPHTFDPNIVDVGDGGLFGEMFNVGMDDEEIIQLAQYENNQPPYLNSDHTEFEFYPGGTNVPVGTMCFNLATGATTGRLVSSYGGSTFVPCGLLQVTDSLEEGDTAFLRITLAPGSYKGVMALPMREVN